MFRSLLFSIAQGKEIRGNQTPAAPPPLLLGLAHSRCLWIKFSLLMSFPRWTYCIINVHAKRSKNNLTIPLFWNCSYAKRPKPAKNVSDTTNEGYRPHSERFCNVALTIKFYCDCDIAKSLRMGPNQILFVLVQGDAGGLAQTLDSGPM